MSYKTASKRDVHFLGNTNTKEVHDTWNEKTNCQLSEIVSSGHAVGFAPDSLDQANSEGFDNCAYCLGNSTR